MFTQMLFDFEIINVIICLPAGSMVYIEMYINKVGLIHHPY